MLEICKEKQIKEHVSPRSFAQIHFTNYGVCQKLSIFSFWFVLRK